MIVFSVHLHIRPEAVDAFREATLLNARGSHREPGCIRFDALQHEEDPNRFVLYEAWRDTEAVEAHRASAHYQVWREAIEPMQAEPRQAVRYVPLAFDREP